MKRGDIVYLGRHRLMCGDSTDPSDMAQLMRGETADMMFTDPPYGVKYTGGHFHSGDVNIKRPRKALANDANHNIYEGFLPNALQFVDGPCYMWYAPERSGEQVNSVLRRYGCSIHALIIWHKTNATYAAMNANYKQRHECCLYFKPKRSTLRWIGPTTARTLWEIPRDAKNTYHPTQKPIGLALAAMENHKAFLVLEPFAGGGSTLIAAEIKNRKCYAMELDPEYCEVIVKRYNDYMNQPVYENGVLRLLAS